ncbi:MAG: hypothetical protein LAT67_05315 [Balneolales bacterium]|nr:hypothetical protein [Balneolales bacterium]
MSASIKQEGYVFTSYGKLKYLHDVIVCVDSIRRYDKTRPIAIYASQEHIDTLRERGLDDYFQFKGILEPQYQSIVGFKHSIHKFMPFDRNLYLDSDMIWCRNPDPLWHNLQPYGFTITGVDSADVFFGASKSIGIAFDILLRRRQKTLKRFGLTHLPRVQTGMMYASNQALAEEVGRKASYFLDQMDQTHFVSRTKEKNRNLESCEWSLGMAMSSLKTHVYPWFNGYETPQLDFIHFLTQYDKDFREVSCIYFCNPFIFSFRGIRSKWLYKLLMTAGKLILPRSMDHLKVTPYAIHFGWNHEKKYFNSYKKRRWEEIVQERSLTSA